MRCPTFMTAALLAVLAAIAGASTLSATAGARPPVALVRVAECSRGSEAAERHATFRGVMRRVAHTERMWMRFVLQERVGNGRFRTVQAPGLGVWHKSRPAVARFSHRQRVLELAKGSDYRSVVSFRWYDAGGELIRRTRRRSRPCRQSGMLPNLSLLRIGGVEPLAGAPGSSSYTVRVINRGQAAAPRFGVRFAVDGVTVDTQTVAGLAAGDTRRLRFTGPACRRSLMARVDPEDTARETSEGDNALTVPCPPAR